MSSFAAIDIGSNTFRLMIAQAASENHITPWDIQAYAHRIVRLGEGLHQSGILCEAAMLRALDAFREFSNTLNQHGVDAQHTYAVATAAMREASNGQAFCQQVFEETGIQIHIIQGDEEASMSLLGSSAVLPPATQKNFLLFDIGGGSTEFVRAKQGQCLDAISRKLGVVRLVEAHLQSDPPSMDDFDAMCQTSQHHLEAVEAHWLASQGHQTPPPALVGTAGTITTLAAIDLDMHDYDANLINNHHISYPRFLQLKEKLLAMTHEERQAMPSIEIGRADLMIAGIAIMDSIFKHWEYQGIKVVDAGLLEGAWLKICGLGIEV